MTAYTFPTRRMLLRDMGRAGLAIAVLGTAACTAIGSEDSGEDEVASGGPPKSSGGTSAPTSSTTSSSTTSPGVTGLMWQRANLGFVSAYILYRAGEGAVIDTGVAGSEQAIEAALGEVGLDWGSIGHVIITHKHPDHQGSLDGVLAAAPDASWHAGEGDMAAITAETRPGTVARDGERVFDLEIIETPGHTPGHISVLDASAGILVAGDAMNGVNGGVGGANPQFSVDMGLANASIGKLAAFDYEVVLFGHGEPVLSGGSAAVKALADTL